MTPAMIVASLLALAVLLASGRWLWRAWRGDAATPPRGWRLLALLVLQAASAVALYLMLFPPAQRVAEPTLVVLGAGVTEAQRAGIGVNDRIVALPEAQAPAGIERVPDLASALRQHPATGHLKVLGQGLTARDREAVGDRSLEFISAPLPRGVVELRAATQVVAGAPWRIAGRVHGVESGSFELLDPAGQRIARQALTAQGDFSFATTARSPGRARFALRIRDGENKLVEELGLPLLTVAGAQPRLRLLAGAPSPELKYLRRWARDAGLRLDSDITLSPGVRVTSGARLDAASLEETDLLILDDRAWSGLGDAQRAVLVEALRGGLGVLLRITGPLSPRDRSSLKDFGFDIRETDAVQTVKLASGNAEAEAPVLRRRPLTVGAADAAVLLRDAGGEPLALWRAEGRGRLGIWWLSDSFTLVLSGQPAAHAALWSDAAGTLARARNAANAPQLQSTDPREQQRLVWCGVDASAEIIAPEGTTQRLLPVTGSATSCAGYWPAQSGWHTLRQDGIDIAFVVRAAAEARALAANEDQQATRQLAARSMAPGATVEALQPGSSWPWLFAWLALSAVLWGLERYRVDDAAPVKSHNLPGDVADTRAY